MHHRTIILLSLLFSVVLIGSVIYFATTNANAPKPSSRSNTQNTNLDADSLTNTQNDEDDSPNNNVTWEFTGETWRANGTPPSCPTPLIFQSPVDVTLATSILYPGQTRGGNYKPHGGFRFDTIEDNQVEVTTPMDSVVIDGARYLVDGEVQYTFDFIAPCGIMFRLGHLLTLSPKFQAIAENFPAARENDSRTTRVEPAISVSEGESIATAIGVKADTNTFVDFGVYDLRKTNVASQNSTWASTHAEGKYLDWYAICWFDHLEPDESARVKTLPPADPQSGTTSDYCASP